MPVLSLHTIDARPTKRSSAAKRTAAWRPGPVGRKMRIGRSSTRRERSFT